jgi:hypothetical protein
MHGSRNKIPSKNSRPHIYYVKFLPLLLAPYIYDISSLRVNVTCICSIRFRKIFKYQISWKSVWWEPSCSVRTDKHTKFCESAPKPTACGSVLSLGVSLHARTYNERPQWRLVLVVTTKLYLPKERNRGSSTLRTINNWFHRTTVSRSTDLGPRICAFLVQWKGNCEQ